MKSSRHKKTPALAGDGALVNEINFQEEIVMANNSTAVSNVTPFRFEAKEVRTILIDDQPWFVAADVCQALAIRNNRDAIARLDDDERGVATTDTPSGQQDMGIINESGLYSLILTSRKAEAKRFKKWITAEVLPSIRKTGRYEDSKSTMATLVGDVIGSTGEVVLNRVIEQKGYRIAPAMQRSFKHTMKSRLRARFNVQKAALIPSDQMEAACNFIVAYAIEGEFLPKQDSGSLRLTDRQAMDLSHLLHSVAWFGHRWNQGICQGLQYLNRDLYQGTVEHVDSMRRSALSLDASVKDLLQEIDQRYRLGGRRPSLSIVKGAV